MAHKLPDLPYANDALEPVISARTLMFHHGKHHAGYVAKLNAALEGTGLEGEPLEKLCRETPPSRSAVYNNAAQAYNHSFFWNSLRAPKEDNSPDGATAGALARAFGSVDAFKEAFANAAKNHFGSGWAWLVRKQNGDLAVTSTHDAHCPLSDGQTPILTIDVWEHAYYLDYQNARPNFVDAFWKVVNWDFVARNLAG